MSNQTQWIETEHGELINWSHVVSIRAIGNTLGLGEIIVTMSNNTDHVIKKCNGIDGAKEELAKIQAFLNARKFSTDPVKWEWS